MHKDIAAYQEIPENSRKMADLIIRNLRIHTPDGYKTVDVSFKSEEIQNEEATDFYRKASIDDLGDLSTSFGYKEFNAEGLSIKMGKVGTVEQVAEIDEADWLRRGYGDLVFQGADALFEVHKLGVNFHENEKEVDKELNPGKNPSFFLLNEGKLRYAVVNGRLISLF